MSNFAYTLNGGAPLLKRHKVGVTVAAGIGVLERSGAGIAAQTTTSLADAVGVTVDAATYTTTQAASMIEGVATVVINPDAVYKSLMVSAATGNTQLNLTTNSAASAGGTVVTITTGDAAPNSPEMAGGLAYCVSGANAGLSRVITSTGATSATVTVPFPQAIAVGDTFILIPWSVPGVSDVTAVFDTATVNVRGDQDAASDASIQVIDVQIDSGFPRSQSYLLWMLGDHILKDRT